MASHKKMNSSLLIICYLLVSKSATTTKQHKFCYGTPLSIREKRQARSPVTEGIEELLARLADLILVHEAADHKDLLRLAAVLIHDQRLVDGDLAEPPQRPQCYARPWSRSPLG